MTETEIAIAIVIVDVGQDRRNEEIVIIEREKAARERGIVGTEIETETEEGNDRSHRLHFPEQGHHLEKVSAPLECKFTRN